KRVVAVGGLARDRQHAARDVVAEHAHVPVGEQATLEDQDGAGIGLLARGAAGGPDHQAAAARPAGAGLRRNLEAERLELVALAKKIGLVGGDALDDFLDLFAAARVVAQELVVVLEGAAAGRFQPRPQAALQEVAGVVLEIDAAVFVDEVPKQSE